MRTFVFLTGFLFFTLSVSAYADRSFSLDVQVNPDGTAHITEKSFFILENKNEIDAFEFVRSQGKTTVADWQRFSRNIRYHLLGGLFNLRIIASREFSLGFTTASLTLDYDVKNMTASNRTSSRRTHYVLAMDKLLFGSSPGDLTLGNNVEFNLVFPADAKNVKVSPDAGVVREPIRLLWVGPTSGRWDVFFDREITLAEEVQAFFLDLYGLLFSSYLLWLLGIVVFSLVVYKVLKTGRH
ncbi:MAG TPA: hypothetical protein VI874_01705 [Candidatus Norongarragalinales archaeon]|nr:hypothetical protein [Candidatus Norongarragalinales archaeon]